MQTMHGNGTTLHTRGENIEMINCVNCAKLDIISCMHAAVQAADIGDREHGKKKLLNKADTEAGW